MAKKYLKINFGISSGGTSSTHYFKDSAQINIFFSMFLRFLILYMCDTPMGSISNLLRSKHNWDITELYLARQIYHFPLVCLSNRKNLQFNFVSSPWNKPFIYHLVHFFLLYVLRIFNGCSIKWFVIRCQFLFSFLKIAKILREL